MQWRRTVRRLSLVGAAAAGAAVGHSIAYLIVAPQGRTRAALLAGTGHGYWSTAVAAEIVLGLLAAASVTARHFGQGLRRQPRVPGDEPWAWLAARICLLQTSIFAVQEIIERAATGHPVGEVVRDRLLFVGFLIQIAVAVVVAALLVWLGRAAEAVGRAFGRGPLPRHDHVPLVWSARSVLPASRPRRIRAIRAPPRPRMA
ncbi:MAG TPA: hypothetical protein VFA46_06860 [Actinomycetes bacterium]|jgi:hypothetical protein|nr:hypothetical protein [Actinomycetes bacterium]